MTTKNLVPRLDGEGKLGVKGATNLNWKEVNAVTGSLSLGKIDELQNQDSNALLVAGTGITITHASGSNGFEYTFDVSAGTSDNISEGQAKVETIDTGTDARIEFWADPNDDGTSSKIWEFSEDGHLLPASNSTFDVGSAEQKVRHLYLSDNSLRLGGIGNTAPYHFGVDENTNKFRVSVDNGDSFESIALASDFTGYATESFVTSQGFATETFVNDALQGLDAKEAADAATTSSLTGFTYASNTFTEDSATGALTIDGFVLSNSDRVLVKDQGSGNEVQHGIYVVSNIDGSSAVTLTRASDITHADVDADDFDGAFIFVLNGTDNAGRSYVAKPTTSGQTTVGTHGMTWVTFTSSTVTALNDLSDVNASSPSDGQVLSWNNTSSEWQSQDLSLPAPTLLTANTTLQSDTDYVIDPNISATITLNLPNSNVTDGSQIKVTNLSSQIVIIQLYDTVGTARLYYADGTEAPTVSTYRDEIRVESQGTIRLYQSGTGDPVKWYLYHSPAFEVETATSSIESAQSLVYSPSKKAFVASGQITSEYTVTSNLTGSLYSYYEYIADFDQTSPLSITLPNRYDHEDICNDLEGNIIYFENRGDSTLTLVDTQSTGRSYITDDDTVNLNVIGDIVLRKGERVGLRADFASVSGDTRIYYRLVEKYHTYEVTEDTSGTNSTITHGRERHLVYIVNTTSNVAVTLPDVSTCKEAYKLTIKNINSGVVTVNRVSTNTFDGLTTLDLNKDEQLELVKRSATAWTILSKDFSSGNLTVRGDTSSGSITLNCEQNSHGVTIQSPPHSSAATYTLTLPDNDGNADQVLKTDGSGVLSWVDQSSGGSSTLGGLTDVSTTNVMSGEVIKYNSSTSSFETTTQSLFKRTSATAYTVTTEEMSNGVYVVYTGSADFDLNLPDPYALITNSNDYNSIDGNSTKTFTVRVGRDIEGEIDLRMPVRLSNTGVSNRFYTLGGTHATGASYSTVRVSGYATCTGFVDNGTGYWVVEQGEREIYSYINIDAATWSSVSAIYGGEIVNVYGTYSQTRTLVVRGRRKEAATFIVNNDSNTNIEIAPYAGTYSYINGSNTTPYVLEPGKSVVFYADTVTTAGVSNWVNINPNQDSATELNNLSDVNITSPTDNSVLVYNSANSEWRDSQTIDLSGNITGAQLRLTSTNLLYQDQFGATFGTDLDSTQASTILQADKPLVFHANLEDTVSIIGRGANNSGGGTSIRLYDAGESGTGLGRNYVKLKVSDKLSSSYTLTLPTDDGTANQVLETDGNGGLSWVNQSSNSLGGMAFSDLLERNGQVSAAIYATDVNALHFMANGTSGTSANASTLPLANSVNAGQVVHLMSWLTSNQSIVNIYRTSPDTLYDIGFVNASTSGIQIATRDSKVYRFVSNGVDTWYRIDN